MRFVRAGRIGHAYWSSFSQKNQIEVVNLAGELHELIFEPEATTPLKTLDLPLGGSKSPIDALAVLIDFLVVSDLRDRESKGFSGRFLLRGRDNSGEKTISNFKSRDCELRIELRAIHYGKFGSSSCGLFQQR